MNCLGFEGRGVEVKVTTRLNVVNFEIPYFLSDLKYHNQIWGHGQGQGRYKVKYLSKLLWAGGGIHIDALAWKYIVFSFICQQFILRVSDCEFAVVCTGSAEWWQIFVAVLVVAVVIIVVITVICCCCGCCGCCLVCTCCKCIKDILCCCKDD